MAECTARVDRAGEERGVDFLGEQALAASLGERPILDRVAGGADDLKRDPLDLPAMRLGQPAARLVRLRERQGRTARAEREEADEVIGAAWASRKILSSLEPKRKRRWIFSRPAVDVRASAMPSVTAMKSSILAFVAVLAASPALAAEDGYPPGLFEHSPVVPGPNDPPDSQGPPPDGGGPPEGNGSLDDYCAQHRFAHLPQPCRGQARARPMRSRAGRCAARSVIANFADVAGL